MRRAIFLDRDGTINRDVGYLNSPDQFELLPGAAKAIRLINRSDFLAVVVTNQAGVAKGFIRPDQLPTLQKAFTALLAQHGAAIDGYYGCPHHPAGFIEPYVCTCRCRKPAPGLLEKAAGALQIDLSRSFVVGDKLTDVQLARNAGAAGILVLTGHGRGELFRNPDASQLALYTGRDICDAVQWVINRNPA